ncbi:MAG: hypothetical protein Q4B79_01960 [Moraxella sp.]|uniref:hypothetical protein n=1 Tax=Moraxella sp. TaxID=479 RepID=UPI0026DB7646|nr:hypothetical protein [Moraxella sp.]MDO4449708.1 hypothetical protein [Moraxella sp.]
MLNHRYHVHVACVADDPLLVGALDDVAIFFESRAFLTKDLVLSRAETASYGWRCINAADVVLVVVGNHYGKPNATGVSQLHVSYTNAKAKNKPVLVFVHHDAKSADDQKLPDFLALLRLQEGESVHYFDDKSNFIKMLESAFNSLDFNKSKGWQATGESVKTALLTPPKPNNPEPKADTKNEPQEMVRPRRIGNDMASLKPALVLDGEFLVNCTAHAFRGGTLIEVSFVMPLKWRQVVSMLPNVVSPFSEQVLGRALNEVIDKGTASYIVARQHADVHAVSRIQVSKSDVLWVLDELELAEWIASVNQGSLWQATDKALNLNK